MLTAGEIRKLIDGKPDDFPIPFYVKYGEVDNGYIFVRIDDVTTDRPAGALVNPDDPAGVTLCLSLVDGESVDDEGEDSWEDDSDFDESFGQSADVARLNP